MKAIDRRHEHDPRRGREGFNLIEVCLAIVVVAFGIITLVGLFPGGLRTVETADKDTRVSFFGSGAMNGIIANANTITNWADWNSDATFRSNVVAGLMPPVGYALTPTAIEYPTGSPYYVRYTLNFDTRVNTRGREISMQVSPDQYGPWAPTVFHTVVSFLGGK